MSNLIQPATCHFQSVLLKYRVSCLILLLLFIAAGKVDDAMVIPIKRERFVFSIRGNCLYIPFYFTLNITIFRKEGMRGGKHPHVKCDDSI